VKAKVADIPRIALTQEEAAAALGVSVTFFTAEIRPELKVVRRGSRRIFGIAELERWLAASESRALSDEA
jgi:hypothetical protein